MRCRPGDHAVRSDEIRWCLVLLCATWQVVFRYYLEGSLAQDAAYVAAGLRESECVQREDTELCEGVQRGMASPAYGAGRCARAALRERALERAGGTVAPMAMVLRPAGTPQHWRVRCFRSTSG